MKFHFIIIFVLGLIFVIAETKLCPDKTTR